MCTEQKIHLEDKNGKDEYQEAMEAYISKFSSLYSTVIQKCDTHFSHGLTLAKVFLSDSYNLLSNNTENPVIENMTSKESTQTVAEMNQNHRQIKSSHHLDVESDDSLFNKNAPNNVQNLKLSIPSSKSGKIDKKDPVGPRNDKLQQHILDNEIRINPLENNDISVTCTHQEETGIPKVKLKEHLTNTIPIVESLSNLDQQSNNKSLETEIRYYDYSLNYYWPIDNKHPLNKERFKQAVKRRKENNIRRSEQQHSYNTPSFQQNKQEESRYKSIPPVTKKWKKTHLDSIKIVSDFRKQTYFEYKDKIAAKEIFPVMSQILDKRVPKPPALPSFTGAGRGGGILQPSSQTINNPWQTVGSKRLEKKLGDVFELTSDKFLPKHLPLDSIPNTTTQEAMALMMPIVFKISRQRKSDMQINPSRTVAAILAAMQNVFHDTYLISQNITVLDQNVLHPLGVPAHDTALSKYITYEPDTADRTLMGWIYMKSNHRLTDYKKDLLFCKYLAREHIVMDEVRLMTINPPTQSDTLKT
jgi:hypothetical protein